MSATARDGGLRRRWWRSHRRRRQVL